MYKLPEELWAVFIGNTLMDVYEDKKSAAERAAYFRREGNLDVVVERFQKREEENV